VQVVLADLDDPASVQRALEGAYGAFLSPISGTLLRVSASWHWAHTLAAAA
jgi:uncharacterized protein YbjT (DUF2867 family)